MQDEAGLDGFAQADLVGQEHAWLQAVGHFLGKVELVLNKIDPPTGKPTVGGFADFGLPGEGFVAHLKEVGLIELAAHEPIEGAGKTNGIRQGGFGDPLPFYLVVQKAPVFFDCFDGTGDAIVGL